ncbi:plasmid replication protein RepC [Sulfitobacter sp. JB4-11]|uniref:plasmid replication protein RepC n=1 Tax=Sulfitobacter rhodophyticola TaxID=3238304 RepID=UPI003514794D
MTYHPITPFRRPFDAALLEQAQAPARPLPDQGVNKWDVLRDLVAARAHFGLSDRELVVLQALLSFHPGTDLGGEDGAPVVYPSNASICERLNGMACSTMRRHLAGLVRAGILQRRDSPNGKRYARRDHLGTQAFGFDLSPLVHLADTITAAAAEARAAEDAYRRQRQSVSLMRRDLASLVAYGAAHHPDRPCWDRLGDLAVLTARSLRRKLSVEELHALEGDLAVALEEIRGVLVLDTDILSTKDAENEQHHQNSNTDVYDLEPCSEEQEAAEGSGPNIPLALVLTTCAEIHHYTDHEIRHWRDLLTACENVRPMMGISPSAWREAMDVMGAEQAAVVLAAMLERFADIRSPGGYLRALTVKAEQGAFSCGPMLMALTRREAA